MLVELEEMTRLWLMSGRQVEPMDAVRLAELRTVFGASWQASAPGAWPRANRTRGVRPRRPAQGRG